MLFRSVNQVIAPLGLCVAPLGYNNAKYFQSDNIFDAKESPRCSYA